MGSQTVSLPSSRASKAALASPSHRNRKCRLSRTLGPVLARLCRVCGSARPTGFERVAVHNGELGEDGGGEEKEGGRIPQCVGDIAHNECVLEKVENHTHAIALHFMYYNFARIHKSLRVTPAMAAGVTERLWDLEDIVNLTD